MRTIFISHGSADKPFVFRLAFELLAEGVPVWLGSWEMGPGDPLITCLDTALDGSARVLVIESSHAAATKWVQYEVDKSFAIATAIMPPSSDNRNTRPYESKSILTN
jgi:hypothetical protein